MRMNKASTHTLSDYCSHSVTVNVGIQTNLRLDDSILRHQIVNKFPVWSQNFIQVQHRNVGLLENSQEDLGQINTSWPNGAAEYRIE